MKIARRDWSIFDGFQKPTQQTCGVRLSWDRVDGFMAMARRYAEHRCSELPGLLVRWNEELRDLGGDPSLTDWAGFRPLRIDREEGWSDWLQHFIATSTTGAFSNLLFSRTRGFASSEFASPSVLREATVEDRRADLVITWKSGSRTHVEVKVGDRNFEKTRETALKLEAKYAAQAWTHYVLLPGGGLDLLP